jgi:hypothetical protein
VVPPGVTVSFCQVPVRAKARSKTALKYSR